MANVVTVNTSAFSRRNTRALLIVLLFILYSNVVPVTKESCLLLSERRLPRELAEIPANEINAAKNEEEVGGKPMRKVPTGQGPTKDGFNMDVKKKAMLNKVNVPPVVRMSQKDAFMGGYHYFKHMKKGYYKMMDYLKGWFHKRALHDRLPHEVMANLWEKYKIGLLDDQNEMEEFCVESIYDFAGNGRVGSITRVEYDEFTNDLRKICRRFTKLSERKWKGIMSDKLRSIRRAMSARRKGRYNYAYDDEEEEYSEEEQMVPMQDEAMEGGGEDDEDNLLKNEEAVLMQMQQLGELIDEEGGMYDEEGELIDEEGGLMEGVGEQLKAEWEQLKM
ncbi:hypothetical protein PVBG_02580, partial [Plasmodium vivax Brazil I]